MCFPPLAWIIDLDYMLVANLRGPTVLHLIRLIAWQPSSSAREIIVWMVRDNVDVLLFFLYPC